MTHPLTPREKVLLKPCPFCGGEAVAGSNFDNDHYVMCGADCDRCGGMVGYMKTEMAAIENWNRRTALASGSGDHAELASGKVCGDRMVAVADALMPWLKNYPPSTRRERAVEAANAAINASFGPLLAENAALRTNCNLATDRSRHWEIASIKADNRATEAERKLAEAVATLKEIAEIEPQPFDGGLDMEAIRTCDECQRYAGHPVQRGICNTHRRPLWDREKHESHEEKALGYRAKSIARTFLSKEAERGPQE